MTGGMLGLAGSTGVASAANNGGSRKISIEQMPSHTHNLYNGYGDNVAGIQVLYWINRPALGSTAWLSSTFTQSTGGCGLYSRTYLRLWLEKNCLIKLVNANGIC